MANRYFCQRVWSRLRQGPATTDELAACGGLRYGKYVRHLIDVGYCDYLPHDLNRIALRKDTGPLAPWPARGDLKDPNIDQQWRSGEQRAWHAMRITRQFSAKDLAALCETDGSTISRYCAFLSAHGYVAQLGRYSWRLAKDTGPIAPFAVAESGRAGGAVCAPIERQLWDANLNTFSDQGVPHEVAR